MKELGFVDLFNEYGVLLTENQSEIFTLYYLCDLSLGEIGEIKGISRQSVSDNISKTKDILLKYEEKLHLLNKRKELIKLADSLDVSTGNRIKEIIGENNG